jgi:hypothetical protein
MTNDERATIYGRAMLELKDRKGGIALLQAYFSEYAERLQGASVTVRRFASDPLVSASIQRTAGEHVKDDNLRLTRADFGEKVDELINLTRRMQELQKQVEQF